MTGTDITLPVLGGGRILVVDAGEDASAALTAVLRLHGFDARTARSARDARAMLPRFHPQVAITSLTLPDAEGCDLIRELRALGDPPTVVVVTGHTEPTRRQAALDAGAGAYLFKPADPDQLVELVRQLIEDQDGRGKAEG
jgi:DNA-binding response OmpR family regulator